MSKNKFTIEDFEKGLMLAGLVTPANVHELNERERLIKFENKMAKDIGFISVKAEFITTFNSFDEWVHTAENRIGGFGQREQIICIDKDDNYCHQGDDMMLVRDNNLFPVRAYRLVRAKEVLF